MNDNSYYLNQYTSAMQYPMGYDTSYAHYPGMMSMPTVGQVMPTQQPVKGQKFPVQAVPACEAMTMQELYKYKTTLCTNYTEGKTCQRFNACTFAHGEAEKRRNPVSPYSVDYLGFNQPIEGAKDPKYCLNQIEYYYHPDNYKTKYCTSFGKPTPCQRGGHCAFVHQEKEMHHPLEKGTLPNLARYQDWIGFFEKLKDPSVNVNEVCLDTHASALHYAAKYAQANICQDLINRGAIVEARDFRGHTPLHACAAFSSPESVATAHVLIQNGAKPDTLDDRGNTAYAVCQRMNVALIELLTNGKGLPPLSDEKLAAQAKRKAAKVNSNFDGDHNPKRVRGDYQQQHVQEELAYYPAVQSHNNNYIGNNYPNNQVDYSAAQKPYSAQSPWQPTVQSTVSEYQSPTGPVNVKCKYDGKVKMISTDKSIGVKAIIKQVLTKFEMTDSSAETKFTLQYQDADGDLIDMEDAEDLQIFLSGTATKLLILTPK
jgi:hypothetical protein